MNISESISRLIALVAKRHRARAETLLNTVGIHAGQEFVLSALWERDGQTQVDLARALAVTPPTVNRMVVRMEEAGLVYRKALTRDPRMTQVLLTKRGRQIRRAVEEVWSKLESETIRHLDVASRQRLALLLAQVAASLADSDQQSG